MDETIRIRSIEPRDWPTILQGFELDKIEQLLELCGSDGVVIGTICESVDGKYYINGQPDFNYASLQVAVAALIKSTI
ncbi:MAG: hypothetical protein U7123_16755 [Potamolinea sp.]